MTDTFDVANKIQLIDRHFQELYRDTASYLKVLERTRLKSERLSVHLKDYATVETPGLKATLSGFSECIQQVEDRRKELYDRLQIKVFEGLKSYETHCKDAKEMLKKTSDADTMQSRRQKELSIINAKNKGDLAKVSAARNSLSKSTQDAKIAREGFYAHLENFEKQKIRDLREMWGDWTHAHILYHSKCLEVMTRAHTLINSVDEDEEMEAILRVTRARQNSDDPLLAASTDVPDSPISRSAPGTPNMRGSISTPPLSQSARLRDSQSLGGSPRNSPQMNSRNSLTSSQQSFNSTPNMRKSNSLQNSTNSFRGSQQQAPHRNSANYDDGEFDD